MKYVLMIFTISLFSLPVAAQSGGPYVIERSVIANGGGQSAAGNFEVNGTIGQYSTMTSGGPGFSVSSGFWPSAPPAAPTAALVSINGRVESEQGRGLNRVTVTLTDGGGTDRVITTSPQGYFTFDDVEVGRVYIVQVRSSRYVFGPVVLSLCDAITEVVIRPAQ